MHHHLTLAPGYVHIPAGLDTLRNGAHIVATHADACTGLYVWPEGRGGGGGGGDDANDADGSKRRARAPRIVTRADATTSFETRQLVARGTHALLVASGTAHAAVVVDWDCERERTRGEHVLAIGPQGARRAPVILGLVLAAGGGNDDDDDDNNDDGAGSDGGPETRVVGVGPRHIFCATLDRRAPARTPLALARRLQPVGGAGAGPANAWCFDANAAHCCIAATRDGRFAVGSTTGRVQLLRELGGPALCTLEGGPPPDAPVPAPEQAQAQAQAQHCGPVRALALARNGAWLCATYDGGVLVAGPLEAAGAPAASDDAAHGRVAKWSAQGRPGSVWCSLAASARAAHGIDTGARYCRARFEYGGSGNGNGAKAGAQPTAVVVALGRALLCFRLQGDGDGDGDGAEPSIASVGVARTRVSFQSCSVHLAPAAIVDHAHTTRGGGCETLALADRLVGVRR